MRRIAETITIAVVISIGVFAVSCGSSTKLAQYRVVQAIPDAPGNLDVSVNGKTSFSNVGFGAAVPVGGYSSVAAGSDPIEVVQTGTSTTVLGSSPLNLVGETQSTVLLTGLNANPTAIVLRDDNTAPLSGEFEIRLTHASPSAPASLDIYLVLPGTDISQLPPTISSLPFGKASTYVPVPIQKNGLAQVALIVTAHGSKTQLTSQIYTLGEGQIRTFVLVDTNGGGALSFVPVELLDFD